MTGQVEPHMNTTSLFPMNINNQQMKTYIVYRVRPFTKRELLRYPLSVNCMHVPLFCCSWKWLTKLMRWYLKADYIMESIDEIHKPEPADDDTFEFDYSSTAKQKLS